MTEAYQVLARKWRPQLFSELKGLEHITRTLKNAIKLNRIGHAFLFTGSRGVGKTSAARIFAKALNCQARSGEEPCNSCENCVAITAGNAADVIEIDGASNRGIDEIRLLRENVTYLPHNSPYKIYIIDEVHMLTSEAFNALLKTLEEPPAHVKFIMATTDVHKMPMTILSRCQRFDFGRLTQAVIAATLLEIGVRENLDFGPGSTELLAREARGSMRDALSLLDQVRSYAGETIAVEDLRQALGLIESRHCFTLLEHVVRGELGQAVSQVTDLEQSGVDLKRFSEEFLFYLRDALFLKLSSKLKKLLTIGDDEAGLLAPLVAGATLPYWQQLFDLWQRHFTQIKASQTPRLALEMALVELGMARDLKPVDELLERIDQYLKSGPESSLNTAESNKKKESAPAGSVVKPEAGNAQVSSPAPAPPEVKARPQNRPSQVREQLPPEPPPPDEFIGDSSVYGVSLPPLEDPGRVSSATNSTLSGPETAVTGTAAAATAPAAVAEKSAVSANLAAVENGEILSSTTAPVKKESSAAVVDTGVWADFVAQLNGRDARLASMLQRSQPELTATGTLRLAVAAHALIVLNNEQAKADILALWSRFQGRESAATVELLDLSAAGARPVNGGKPAAAAGSAEPRRSLPSKEEIFNDPSVRFISERFGGRVTDIKAN
jgi:DNA polymerase-3 subunit gamma/tau